MRGSNQIRKLRPAMLAEYAEDGESDDVRARLASVARLSQPLVESG